MADEMKPKKSWRPLSDLSLTNDGQAVLVTDDGTWVSMAVCRRGRLYESTANGLQTFDEDDSERLWWIDLADLFEAIPLPPADTTCPHCNGEGVQRTVGQDNDVIESPCPHGCRAPFDGGA